MFDMKYKLIPLDVSPIYHESAGNRDHWRGGAKNFFIVDPVPSNGSSEEKPARELRCTIDLLLELDGKTFYDENRFYRVAHTYNERGYARETGFALDFGMADMPGGTSFLEMLYQEQAPMELIGKFGSRAYGTFWGIATWVIPMFWPLLQIRAWRGIPRMDKVMSGARLNALYPLDHDFIRLSKEFLGKDYTKDSGQVFESCGEWLGMGHILPIPLEFMEDGEYKKYNHRLVHAFVESPPCSVVRR